MTREGKIRYDTIKRRIDRYGRTDDHYYLFHDDEQPQLKRETGIIIILIIELKEEELKQIEDKYPSWYLGSKGTSWRRIHEEDLSLSHHEYYYY